MSTPVPYNEQELLHRVTEGDEKAFASLVDLYWNKIYSLALAFCKDAGRAQDITQEVFIKVWNKRTALNGVDDFKSWLFIIGRNQVLSAMRKRLEVYAGEQGDTEPEDVLVPDRQLEMKETEAKVMEAINRLSPVRQKVFRLSKLDGLTYEQIATELGISKNTVKEHMVQALNQVRTYLHHHGDITALFFFYIYFFRAHPPSRLAYGVFN